jgi:hypothetical protein
MVYNLQMVFCLKSAANYAIHRIHDSSVMQAKKKQET